MKIEKKIWGVKIPVLEDKFMTIDRLILKKDTFSSWHYHVKKSNIFVLKSGIIRIEYDRLEDEFETLENIGEVLTVRPNNIHRFVVCDDNTEVLEICFNDDNTEVNNDDIVRLNQGGKIINGVEYSLDAIIKKLAE